jgi:hypothetical protein
MSEELAEALIWMIRVALFAGIAWGGWLCVSSTLPPRSEKSAPLEHVATFALLVLLFTTLGGMLRGG